MNQRKLVKCSICNNLKSDWCEKVHDSPDKYFDRNCEYFSLKTHGDKLRETEDDKLAELFARFCAGQQGALLARCIALDVLAIPTYTDGSSGCSRLPLSAKACLWRIPSAF